MKDTGEEKPDKLLGMVWDVDRGRERDGWNPRVMAWQERRGKRTKDRSRRKQWGMWGREREKS